MKGIETAFRGQGITGGRAGKMAKKAMEAEALGKKPKKRMPQRHESVSVRGACSTSLHDVCARLRVSCIHIAQLGCIFMLLTVRLLLVVYMQCRDFKDEDEQKQAALRRPSKVYSGGAFCCWLMWNVRAHLANVPVKALMPTLMPGPPPARVGSGGSWAYCLQTGWCCAWYQRV